MSNKRKVLELNDNEELLVIFSGSVAYSINKNGISSVDTHDLEKIQANMEIVTINFDELKRFILFDVYFQHIMALDVDENIKRLANKFMDYHLNIIHGKLYEIPNLEVKDHEFQCITYY